MRRCTVLRRSRGFALIASLSLLAACGTAPTASPPLVENGPARPTAIGDPLEVIAQNLEAPVILDPIPEGLRVQELTYNPLDTGYPLPTTTLYGDPSFADTLDGPVLLVGTSAGSANIGGPPGLPEDGRPVEVGGEQGFLLHHGDRTWVSIPSGESDYVEFAVGRGVSDEDMIRAANGAEIISPVRAISDSYPATIAVDAIPSGLEPLVTGSPQDGPYTAARGESIRLTGGAADASVTVRVFAVRADPRLAALWGFWAGDPGGTLIRGQPGSVGELDGIGLGGEPRGRVWAEDGMVLSVIAYGASEELVDQVVASLRVGTAAELEEMRLGPVAREPAPEDVGCRPGALIVSADEGAFRWAFGLGVDPAFPDLGWMTCSRIINPEGFSGAGSGGFNLAPLGEISAQTVVAAGAPPGSEGTIVGGVAPPGTERVTIAGPYDVVRDAVLLPDGPRPGERLFGQYLLGMPGPTGISGPFHITAVDVNGAVIATLTL